MTLDEAISEFKERAEDSKKISELGMKSYIPKAKEEEQLAEWLEDYKRLKAERPARANRIRRIWCYGYDKGVADVMSKVKELQEKN